MNVHTCIQCRCYCFAICVHIECALPHCVLCELYLKAVLPYKRTKYRTHHMSSDQIYTHVLADLLQPTAHVLADLLQPTAHVLADLLQPTDAQGDSLFI